MDRLVDKVVETLEECGDRATRLMLLTHVLNKLVIHLVEDAGEGLKIAAAILGQMRAALAGERASGPYRGAGGSGGRGPRQDRSE